MSYHLTNKQNEFVNQKLDITINVSGANLTTITQKLLPVFDSFSLERVDYFSRTQFVLPLEQQIAPDFYRPQYYDLSVNSLAPIHCLVIPESLQEQFGISLNSSDLVVSENLLSTFDKEKGEILDIWVQLLSNTFFSEPPVHPYHSLRGTSSSNTSSSIDLNLITHTLTHVISREAPLWLNHSSSKVFGEDIASESTFFYSPLLFNTSDLESLNFQNNHVGQVDNFNNAEANEAYYLMMSPSMLNQTSWSHFLTDFSFAIDIDPDEIRFNQNDLSSYLTDLTDRMLEQLMNATSLSDLLTFKVNNHLLTKIDTTREVVNDQFLDIMISLIPYFILNLFLSFIIQKKIIERQEKTTELMFHRGTSRLWLFRFYGNQSLINFTFIIAITLVGLFLLQWSLSSLIVFPGLISILLVLLYLYIWNLSFSIEAIRRKIFLQHMRPPNTEDLIQESDLNENNLKKIPTGFTLYLFSAIIIGVGTYFINTFEKIFVFLDLAIIRFALLMLGGLVLLVFILSISDSLFNFYSTRIKRSTQLSEFSQLVKEWKLKFRIWDINIVIRKKEPFDTIAAIFRSLKKAAQRSKSLWVIFTVYLLAFGFYAYPLINDTIDSTVDNHNSVTGDEILVLPPAYDPTRFVNIINDRPEVREFLAMYEIKWYTYASTPVHFLYTDVTKFADMMDLWDESEEKSIETKIKDLRYQNDECLFNSAKAEELGFNENDLELFHVPYFNSVNTMLNLEGISFTVDYYQRYEISGLLDDLPLPFEFDALLNINALPVYHPEMLFRVPKLFINLRAVIIDFTDDSAKESFNQFLKTSYPDIEYYDRTESGFSQEVNELVEKINIYSLTVYLLFIVIASIIIYWIFIDDLRKTTNSINDQMINRGLEKTVYLKIRGRYSFLLGLFKWANALIIMGLFFTIQFIQNDKAGYLSQFMFKSPMIQIITLIVISSLILTLGVYYISKEKIENHENEQNEQQDQREQ
jgi:hypothetical protein